MKRKTSSTPLANRIRKEQAADARARPLPKFAPTQEIPTARICRVCGKGPVKEPRMTFNGEYGQFVHTKCYANWLASQPVKL